MHEHGPKISEEAKDLPKIVLVGNPNVGKSVMFALFTGSYVTVSNYPGTTVEVTRGVAKVLGEKFLILDTPGANNLIPMSEDEQVTRDILLKESDVRVIQVADAKNLRRGLLLSLQLAELGIEFVLDINMHDEALSRGIEIDADALGKALGVETVITVATRKEGLDKLKKRTAESTKKASFKVRYDERIEAGIAEIEVILAEKVNDKARGIALMFIAGDESILVWASEIFTPGEIDKIEQIRVKIAGNYAEPMGYVISKQRLKAVDALMEKTVVTSGEMRHSISKRLGELAMHPFWGIPVLLLVLYVTWYIVGNIGAGISVDFLESKIFGSFPEMVDSSASIVSPVELKADTGQFHVGDLVDINGSGDFHVVEGISGGKLQVSPPLDEGSPKDIKLWNYGQDYSLEESPTGFINPIVVKVVYFIIPWDSLNIIRELIVGPYGMVTVAITYSVAIVLPIVGFFFIVFGILEDSGYLPRLAVMVNRIFKTMGLNGKAVLPMVLGLGCDTMATLTTRILETPRERLIVILLLALGIPCSAQLGVILGIFVGNLTGAIVWGGVVVGVLFIVGFLAAQILPGQGADFILELPPIRVPQLKNLIVKTVARMEWYLKEAVPLFILGTLVLFVLDKAKALGAIERAASPVVVGLLGLPPKATEAFIVGFLRRDYGAAGLFTLHKDGMLNGNQVVVAMVTITLFIPCIANLFIIIKERGWKTAVAMSVFIFPFAFLVGGALNFTLKALNIEL